jgi:DNA repair photolyase
MVVNKQKGNMYGFVTHTWNAVIGKCPHDCQYCYMKSFPLHDLRLSEHSLTDRLGTGNVIFVGSSCDMWADAVPDEWIDKVLEHCKKFDNTYLFQTKNPKRFWKFIDKMPQKIILGTTIESNRDYPISKAPQVEERAAELFCRREYETMVTIEPIMDFDLRDMVRIIKKANPKWVNIGADSKRHKLPEPSKEKVEALIKALGEFTEVRCKNNLERLMK